MNTSNTAAENAARIQLTERLAILLPRFSAHPGPNPCAARSKAACAETTGQKRGAGTRLGSRN